MTDPKFPEGKLNKTDEGITAVAVTVANGVVVLAFPKPVAWIGMDYETAMSLASTIKHRAAEIRRN